MLQPSDNRINPLFVTQPAEQEEVTAEQKGVLEGHSVAQKTSITTKEAQNPQQIAQAKTEQSCKKWFEILSRSIEFAVFALTTIGEKFISLVNKIQSAVSHLFEFGKLSDKKAVEDKAFDKTIDVINGSTMVRALLQDKTTKEENKEEKDIGLPHQFIADLLRSSYSLNGEVLLDRKTQVELQGEGKDKEKTKKLQEIKENLENHFTKQGVLNLASIMQQSITNDCLMNVTKLNPNYAAKSPEQGLQYAIREEGDMVHISIVFPMMVGQNEEEGSLVLTGEGEFQYAFVRKNISIHKDELAKDWTKTEDESQIAPSLKVTDYYTGAKESMEEAKAEISSSGIRT